ncbi:hypothetical protein [Sinorhizobium meliloti]|uniref:Uncharacterized protein n=1 Tax=Rhizobium meliloti TaxID=382 RepID=A0AAW9TUS6_RHIML|nr:hypothetical protein [Sinorhizobium meliloti]ASP84787.1 hypothetical protein CDO26_09380 [Sinorhizobium meliloti]MCM5689540.1 hypothetical protein [Sinorhizobium meliloti]MDX0182727.1 hypothetical protein [Sinorhizobium meliloti]MQW27073.1 hypothetical protein [Sinorhizobium meliloti]MQW35054.1 hypothetical protein [Sinorhizobium meliloti]
MPNIPVQAAAKGLSERHTAVAEAMLTLEEQVTELEAMSRIMADLLEEVLSSNREKEGEYFRILVSRYDMENISFAWNNVTSRAVKLADRYYDACRGEIGQ